MKEQNKLLPCPRNGKSVRESDWTECEQCGLRLDEYEDFETVWNTRAESEVSKYKNALEVALEFISFVNSSDRADGALSALALNKIQEITQAIGKASQ